MLKPMEVCCLKPEQWTITSVPGTRNIKGTTRCPLRLPKPLPTTSENVGMEAAAERNETGFYDSDNEI